MSNHQDIYAFYRDRSKYVLNEDLNDISTLKNDVQTINSNIDTINGDIETINGDIDNINGDIDNINGDIDNINGDIDNIENNYSQVGHTHSTSDITSGTLSISHGGTGGTTAAAARKSLGLSFSAGDVIAGTAYGAGYVTGSGQYFAFEIPLSKVIDGTISMVNMSVVIRQGGYYIFGSVVDGQSVAQDVKNIATITKINGGIRVELRPSSAPQNVTNNDNFGVVCSYRINVS